MGIKITVKLIGHLIERTGFSEKEMEVTPGADLTQLREILGISDQLPLIVTVNGKGTRPDLPLKDGDRVVISPVYSGG